MKRIIALLIVWAKKIRKYISPAFLLLFAVSFTLWYIAKLSYTYTTELAVKINVNGHQITVPCGVEAQGSILLRYKLSGTQKVAIPLSELKYDVVDVRTVKRGNNDSLQIQKIAIQPTSIQDALSVRFSDLQIKSVGKIADIEIQKR